MWYGARRHGSGISRLPRFFTSFIRSAVCYRMNVPTGADSQPGDAWNIDTKLDDGLPGQGMINSSAPGLFTTCTTTANSSSAAYALSTVTACGIVFNIGF